MLPRYIHGGIPIEVLAIEQWATKASSSFRYLNWPFFWRKNLTSQVEYIKHLRGVVEPLCTIAANNVAPLVLSKSSHPYVGVAVVAMKKHHELHTEEATLTAFYEAQSRMTNENVLDRQVGRAHWFSIQSNPLWMFLYNFFINRGR